MIFKPSKLADKHKLHLFAEIGGKAFLQERLEQVL